MPSKQALAFVAVMLVGGGSVMALSLRGKSTRPVKVAIDRSARPYVTPSELADWVIEGRRDFVVVDLRAPEAFDRAHLRDAIHCGTCHEDKQQGKKAQAGEHFIDLSKKIVLYTESGKEPVALPRLIASNPRLYFLTGGWQAWQQEILQPVEFGGEVDAVALEAKQRREARRAFFAGEGDGASSVAKLPVTPIRRQGEHKTAAASEGC